MSRRRKKLPVLEQVEISDAVSGGKALGKLPDGMVVFVNRAVPGDIVDVQLTKKKKNFLEGFPVKFHHFSQKRIKPFCAHFSICGGCRWQNMSYQDQLFYKQKQVVDALERIGKLQLPEIEPILPSPATRYYRNKLEFNFSHSRWLTPDEIEKEDQITDRKGLGFHVGGRFDKIVDVQHCYLQPNPSNQIRLAIKDFALKNDYSFYNLVKHEGYMRTIIIRTSTLSEVMLIVVFAYEDTFKRKALLDYLVEKFPEITSLFYVINTKLNEVITDLEVNLYAGRDHIFEQMGDLKFKIGPKSFYQTNPEQAHELYKLVARFADIRPDETVYDLYTGTGTIAIFVARQAQKVIGIEYVPEAIEDARINAGINGIANTFFFAGDMKNILKTDFVEQNGSPDVLITDPPRAGMHPDAVETILKAKPARIVYVSCNPTTQARDLGLLSHDYQVQKVQPVDMFPQTHHVENVVLLQRRPE